MCSSDCAIFLVIKSENLTASTSCQSGSFPSAQSPLARASYDDMAVTTHQRVSRSAEERATRRVLSPADMPGRRSVGGGAYGFPPRDKRRHHQNRHAYLKVREWETNECYQHVGARSRQRCGSSVQNVSGRRLELGVSRRRHPVLLQRI